MRKAAFALLTILDVLMLPVLALWLMTMMHGAENHILNGAFMFLTDIFAAPILYLRERIWLFLLFALAILLYGAGIVWDMKKQIHVSVGYVLYEVVFWAISIFALVLLEEFYKGGLLG